MFLGESLVTINSTKESTLFHPWTGMFSVLWGKSFSTITFLNIIHWVDKFGKDVRLIPRLENPLITYLFSPVMILRKNIHIWVKMEILTGESP